MYEDLTDFLADLDKRKLLVRVKECIEDPERLLLGV